METTLTQKEIAFAMTNNPALSDREVMLGDRKVNIVNLSYDDYTTFVSLLMPLLEAVASKVVSIKGLPSVAPGITPNLLLRYSSKELPEMARLACKGTYPDITVEEIKELAGNPFALAGVVFAQINANQMIGQITDFFVQMLPLVKDAMRRLPQGAANTETTL